MSTIVRTTGERRRRNPLTVLIDDHCRRSHESLSDVARRAGLARQTVWSLATRDDWRAMPKRDTLAALARGLRLPEAVVVAAASSAAGLDVLEHDEDADLTIIVAAYRDLHDDERAALRARALSLLWGQDRLDGSSHTR